MNFDKFIAVSLLGIFLISLALGQWSEPAPVYSRDTIWLEESKLICAYGDTLWVAYIESDRWRNWYQICAHWSLGDTWSEPFNITGRDSMQEFYWGLGFDVDPCSRLWLSWYRGGAYTFQEDSWAICTAMHDSVWHPFEKSICPFYGGGAKSLAADRQGNWHMGIELITHNEPGFYTSAMYSILDGDTWVAPIMIEEGTPHPAQSDEYCPTLVTHPVSGVWSVSDREGYMWQSCIHVHHVTEDSVFPSLTFEGTSSVATADSSGRLWVVFWNDSALRSVVMVDTAILNYDVVPTATNGPQGICTDPEGWVWVAWGQNSVPIVSYNWGDGWSQPEQVSDSVGYPKDIVSDSRGKVYVLLWLRYGDRWGLYSTYREYRPGILDTKPPSTAPKLPFVTIAKDILKLHGNEPAFLLDITGRKRFDLIPGLNNVQVIPAGVYFIKSKNNKEAKKIIIQH